MKRLFVILIITFLVLNSPFKACAAQSDSLASDYGADKIIDSLPDEAKDSLSSIGLNGLDINALSNLSLDKIFGELFNSAAKNGKAPVGALAVIIAVMLLYSLIYGIRSSFDNNSLQQVMSVCLTLCVTGAITAPVISVIQSGISVITIAANFMLAYLPVMLAVMTAAGNGASGGSYYALMTFAGEIVSQAGSNIISPFLKVFLGLSVASAVSPNVNLGGFIKFISKLCKWLLGFVMTIFTGVLTLRQLVSSGLDSVTTRAVKFTISSLVPVVGTALSEAYKTVRGSVGLLRSGIGVFALIAVIVVFAPVIIQCLWWMLVLWASKAAGELMGLKEICFLFESVSGVVTLIMAILLCVAAVFIISTSTVLILGGSG